MAGLMDFLFDPEKVARAEERRLLIEHVAGQLNISKEEAKDCLDSADATVADYFEGNVIPFRRPK